MKVTTLTLSALAFFAAVSCTKTNNIKTTVYDTTTIIHRDTVWVKKPLNPITGLWVGKYIIPNSVDSIYYSMDIQPTGNLITTAIANGSSTATSGPWQLNGTALTASVLELSSVGVKVAENITATYDSTAGTLTGQWKVTAGGVPDGSFRLLRVVP